MATEMSAHVLCLGDCQPETVEWLWPGRLAAGKLTLIDGDPDRGKSLLTLDVAARLTAGRPLPDGHTAAEPLSVVLVASEDGVRDTILPRLRTAGADVARVHVFLGPKPDDKGYAAPLFPDDCELLRATLEVTGARLVVIDPLGAVLGRKAGGETGALVRQALGPLTWLAEQAGAALLIVRHLTKGGRGLRALYRGSGRIDIIGVARCGFLVGAHPEDDSLRVLACTKSNLAEPPPALGFRLLPGDAGEPIVAWTGPLDISADDLVLAPPRPYGAALAQARTFLAELLHNGPCVSEDAFRQAQAAGISRRTLERAKAELQVISEMEGPAGLKEFVWRLPHAADHSGDPDWPERHQRELEEAQKESDEFMARLRAKYGYAYKPPSTGH
jgi:hypothetical protein